jgi:hypothetical protein
MIFGIINFLNSKRKKMGLGKKLGQQNKETETIISKAHTPIGEGGGYNAENLGLKSQPVMTQAETKAIYELQATASKDAKGVTKIGHLVRPSVPKSTCSDRNIINELVVTKMWRIIYLRKLQNFYTQESLQKLVNRACSHDYRLLMKQYDIATIDMTVDLAVLGLYDIVIFADDSGSMKTEEPSEDNLSRWQILKEVVKTLGFWATLMDPDGIVIRFFNSSVEGNGISDSSTVDEKFRKVTPNYSTPMGSQLREKILDKFVYKMLEKGDLSRPILIITATDGVPDKEQDVLDAIIECHEKCSKSKYGEHAVAFSFAQIGKDSKASSWLASIDKHDVVGKLIDCTSEYSAEKKECEDAYPGIKFTPSTWLVKSMIGPIDPEYDQADEGGESSSSSAPQTYGPPTYGPPTYGPPTYGPPTYGPPTYGPPTYGPPTYGPQTYGPPTYGSPTYTPSSSGSSSSSTSSSSTSSSSTSSSIGTSYSGPPCYPPITPVNPGYTAPPSYSPYNPYSGSSGQTVQPIQQSQYQQYQGPHVPSAPVSGQPPYY